MRRVQGKWVWAAAHLYMPDLNDRLDDIVEEPLQRDEPTVHPVHRTECENQGAK